MNYTKLNFGTAGIPVSCQGNILDGLRRVRELGLSALELEFVRSVNIKEEKAKLVRKAAKENAIELTAHGQYYINLNSLDEAKMKASIERVISAARIADLCGAKSVTFHAAYYMKEDSRKVYNTVRNNIREILRCLHEQNITITLSPETTGKPSQFGTIPELVELAQELEEVRLCIDFSHLYARSLGKVNSYDSFSDVLAIVENKLGRDQLNNMHIHTSGIEYGNSGEKNHVNLKECPLKYKDLVQVWKDYRIKGVVISESPNIEEDALLLKKTYEG